MFVSGSESSIVWVLWLHNFIIGSSSISALGTGVMNMLSSVLLVLLFSLMLLLLLSVGVSSSNLKKEKMSVLVA